VSEPLVRLQTSVADRYVIERELGAGGMATVYLARDVRHDRHVALKVLRPELAAVLGAARFLAEIKITARLDHPHIMTLIDSGEADGFLFYVLPFIRGESLRDKLNREKQLGLEEALAITKQIAGALDYAHRQGVVHRDIKPENILLHEGEAMLADFGIALAVKEAGGNRLTETGLSLGTPQYMSPEQATGDRSIDARSDVYSLAAVLYEMLAGEPPLSGPTVQAIIAKLLTERPTHLAVVRDTVPQGVDAAVAKALSKVPADRFADAAAFARALEGAATTGVTAAAAAPASGSRRLAYALAIGGVAVLGAIGVGGGWALLHRHRGPAVVLRDRSQLTFTGNVQIPALSQDGKQLAYFTRRCSGSACTFAIDVQDVGGTTTRRILDGATAAYALEWSPDRRNLVAQATIGGHWGNFLISALGGAARYLGSGAATFFAGGDSLLLGPAYRPDSVYWVKVAGLDGSARDSIRVPGPGEGLAGLTVVPGTPWFVALVIKGGHGLWQVLDRGGRVRDHVLNRCTCPGRASSDALWVQRAGNTASEAIVRMGIDRASGRFASQQDTVYYGVFTDFSVTSDGAALALDDGTYEFSSWAVDLADALHGRFPDARRVLRSSTSSGAQISPDGERVLLSRRLATAAGQSELRLTVMPFGGGAETTVPATGTLRRAKWADSVTIAYLAQTNAGLHLALVDVRSGTERQPLDLSDSIIGAYDPLPGGWAWVPVSGDHIEVQDAGGRRQIPKPAWAANVAGVSASPDGRTLAFATWNASTDDTLRVDVVPTVGGSATPWVSMFAETGGLTSLADGTLLFTVFLTEQSATLIHLRGPGQVERLGSIPRPVEGVSASRDLRRVTVNASDYHGDVWLSKVVRQ
jgi:hypothetical protein